MVNMYQAWKPLLDRLHVIIAPYTPIMYYLVAVGVISCICIMIISHSRGGDRDD